MENTFPLGRENIDRVYLCGKILTGEWKFGGNLKENGRKRKDLVKIEDERVNGANVRVKEVSEE